MSCLPIPVPTRDGAVAFDPFASLLHRVMAGEIREIREKLEALADLLAPDAHFAEHYLEQFQTFDYLVQHADECVNLLTRIADGENSLEAIGHVRLGAVQERLRVALGG